MIFEKLDLIEYDPITNEPYITFVNWINRIICFFKRHQWEFLFRTPKENEKADPNWCGLVRMSNEICKQCGKPRWGINPT